MKRCTKCFISKPKKDYHLRGDGKRRNDCRDCVRLYGIKYREKNKKLIKRKKREYHKENPHIKRRSYLKLEYGLTLEDYDKLLKSQNGLCKICNADNPNCEQHKHLYIDHCHSTGKVRGLLCGRCNSAIGHMKDNIEYFEKAIEYLKEFNDD